MQHDELLPHDALVVRSGSMLAGGFVSWLR
jgi:hypothetical protein